MKRLFRTRDFQPDAHQDVAEELRSHLELKVEDLMAQGMSEDEAWTEARRAFGAGAQAEVRAVSQTRSRLRRRSLADRFETVRQDLRYAFRRMVRSPGFTAAAILSLAIGIGANTAVFSVVNAVLLRPLPYRAPEELVRIYTRYPGLSPWGSSAYPDYLEMKALDEVFDDVAVFYNILAPITIQEEPQMAMVEAVSSSFFPMLGVVPVLGRRFLPDEDQEPGQSPVALLGHALWERSYGGDPDVLGRTLRIGGRPYTIVGVAPASFGSGVLPSLKSDVIVPVSMGAQIEGASDGGSYTRRGYRTFDIEARLKAGVTVEEARARLGLLASQLQEAYPESNRDRSYTVLPAEDVTTSPEVDEALPLAAGFLLGVVGLVLLLACTNLASFLLAQGVRRGKEIALRLAMGAQRGRLVRQLLSETLLLGLLGGGAGLLVAVWSLGLLKGLLPSLPAAITLDLGMDWRVLFFTLILSLGAGVLFGLAPALQSTRPNLTQALKDSGPSLGRRRFRLQSALVAFQMAISVVLLVGGGLFVRALLVAENIDPGFNTEGVGTAWIDLPMSGVPREAWATTESELMDRLLAEPGIESVTAASQLPLALGNSFQLFTIPGVEPPSGQDGHQISYAQVSPEFFTTLEIPILRGRGLVPEDGPGAPEVIVVNEKMAETFWPREDPIGKQVLRGAGDRVATVVGVAKDTKITRLGQDPPPFLYLPRAQFPTGNLRLAARGREGSVDLRGTLHRVLREVNPNFAVMEVKSMEDHVSLLLFPSRLAALLLGVFGGLALLLAAIGLYGVVNFSVATLTREIGIRMSLGAEGGTVIATVMKGAMGVVVLGGILGLALAFALARVIQVFLFGVRPGDPLTMSLVPALLCGVAFVAALIPARRATRVNPTEALQSE
ncbi:ADOP family duplicated permease [Gemmatimonadota bacterium]